MIDFRHYQKMQPTPQQQIDTLKRQLREAHADRDALLEIVRRYESRRLLATPIPIVIYPMAEVPGA